MLVFVDNRIAPFADWVPVDSGWAFIPKYNLRLLVYGVIYEVPAELPGFTVQVHTYDGDKLDIKYVA